MNKRNSKTDGHYSNVDDDDATQKQTKHTRRKREYYLQKNEEKYILRFRCCAEQF